MGHEWGHVRFYVNRASRLGFHQYHEDIQFTNWPINLKGYASPTPYRGTGASCRSHIVGQRWLVNMAILADASCFYRRWTTFGRMRSENNPDSNPWKVRRCCDSLDFPFKFSACPGEPGLLHNAKTPWSGSDAHGSPSRSRMSISGRDFGRQQDTHDYRLCTWDVVGI